ncbi:hypothetical protein FRB90_008778 [Tulasnella sp. 427]|nr:hypothetical protein FRB90_008778 [Tulasnella sp. 427]
MPVYITATALGKLGHPDGELNLTRAAGKHGVIQMIPTLASCSFDEIMDAGVNDQVFFMQLYVNKDREKTKKIAQHAEKRGVKALFITVDAPQLGRREKDMRMKFEDSGAAVQAKSNDQVDRNQGAARAISSFIDPGLSWSDIPWFRSITKMPIILKGVQCWEDAVLAAEAGCDGIVLSNHGGRQLDTTRSGIEILPEVVDELRKRGLFPNPNFSIFVDGGIRRATDVLKAIALGATAVGVGRAFIYAFSAYGQEGVEKAIKILDDEFEMNMRLIGARNLSEVVPSMVDASSLNLHVTTVPEDRLYRGNYEAMRGAALLAQYVPLMFVAGLTEGQSPSPAPGSPIASSPPPELMGRSSSGSISLPSTPAEAAVNASSDGNPADPFADLISRLRTVLTYRKKGAVWDPLRARAFQVILVDKPNATYSAGTLDPQAVRFPHRKVYPPAPRGEVVNTAISSTPHSPLSPMSPTSPVYPDGLITPIWIRKHVELVPSVFVLFLRLSENFGGTNRLEGRDDTLKEEERKRDAELATEISNRKKATGERGIKLTVVLLASRQMLGWVNRTFHIDDPSLDSRLSFIRRQGGLDSRAALFVLSPVSQSELNDFVKSLQSALREPAMEYYAAHSKRVRKKRNRHSHANSASISGMPALPNPTPGPRPLRSIGWQVRYDYKLAIFAEFRMEEEVARKHYEDCWTSLVEMFGSTAILPPRTKRWAEAKVLADCVATKLTKLFLYHNEPHLALATFNRHLQKFSELSRGWGIGEETFEFWSWQARQYRILAELLELAIRAGYKLPIPTTPPPLPGTRATGISSAAPNQQNDPKNLGTNPAHVLQHPGYFYYLAATCTQQRYERFLAAVQQEERQPGSLSQSPGFVNEKKVEHHAVIIELFTKAYELFKRYRSGQSRQTFYIAYRIAETYHGSGNYESAIRFFERIAKTYRREHWGSMLHSILLMWYDCARHLKDVELTVRLLYELLAPGVTIDEKERTTYEGDLDSILQNSSPSGEEPLVIELPEGRSILDTTIVFWRPEVSIGEAAPFQISTVAPDDISLSSLPLTGIRIQFEGSKYPLVVIEHVAGETEPTNVQRIDIGQITTQPEGDVEERVKADLRWPVGATKVFCGTLLSGPAGALKAKSITFLIKRGNWNIEVPYEFEADGSSGIFAPTASKPKQWLVSLVEPFKFTPVHRTVTSVCTVRPKPHSLHVEFQHSAPAYLDERYPLVIKISNIDERELDTVVDVLLHPAEDESGWSRFQSAAVRGVLTTLGLNAVNKISFEEQESTGLIKGVQFGTLQPGSICSKTLYISSSGFAGNRVLDISIRTRAHAPQDDASAGPPPVPESPSLTGASADSCELLRTIAIPVVRPFDAVSQTTYHRTTAGGGGGKTRHSMLKETLDLSRFDREEFDVKYEAMTVSELGVGLNGRCGVEVDGIEWVEVKTGGRARLVSSSLNDAAAEDESDFPLTLEPTDKYAVIHRFHIDTEDEVGRDIDEKGIPCPGELVIKWRRTGNTNDPWSTSRLSFPTFRPPPDTIIGIVHVPPSATLHRPFPVTLTVQNRQSIRSADLILSSESTPAAEGGGFIIAGPKQCRLPTLLPNSSVEVKFNVVPMVCGIGKLPGFKVLDRRGAGGGQDVQITTASAGGATGEETIKFESVQVVDERLDARDEEGVDLLLYVPGAVDPAGGRKLEVRKEGVSILVLPS